MNLPELITLMQTGTLEKLTATLNTHRIIKDISEAIKEYDPEKHSINDKSLRPDRVVKDDAGNLAKIVKPGRLTLALQKKIVLTAVGFLGTPEVECTPKNDIETKMLFGVMSTWDHNKLDYCFKKIAKTTKSQLHCAELWSIVPVDPGYWEGAGITGKFGLSMQLLKESDGNKFHPVFDEFGNMIAFGRGYTSLDENGKEINHFDIYTATEIYYTKQVGGDWLFADVVNEGLIYSSGFKSIENKIGKIPIIYYYQHLTDWQDVQTLIDRLEFIASNLADTNDYTGSPILIGEGETGAFADKGDPGKYFQLEIGAKLSYLKLDGAPESIRMEWENLYRMVFNLTHTPDDSFENMKGLGALSGVAIKLLFMDAHLKAADSEEIFGEGLQRRMNFIKTALIAIDGTLKPALNMKIRPKFTFFLPANITEEIANITASIDNGTMSEETGIGLNPLIVDAVAEMKRIKAEKESAPIPVNNIV